MKDEKKELGRGPRTREQIMIVLHKGEKLPLLISFIPLEKRQVERE